MAVLSFPLSLSQFFHLMPVSKIRLDLGESLEVNETVGGEVLVADLGTQLWSGQIDLGLMLHHEAAAVRPLINLLRRAGASFLVSDLTRPWPRLDPEGVLLGAAAPTLLAIGGSGREVSIAGLPAGYTLSRGDLLSWTYGSNPARYALHEVIGGGTASGLGQTPMMEVGPPVRPGSVTGAAVQLIYPRCKAFLTPGSSDTGTTSHTVTTDASFGWMQTLR